MVSMTLYADIPSREELVKAIEGWEESVKWIAHGWDCEDEYWHDLSYRERLDDVVERYTSLTPLSKKLRKRIERADDRFRKATVVSRLCVWDTEVKIDAGEEQVSFACDEYDPERYWYYYRWPPDAPRYYLEYDAYELQKHCYGLDFKGMTRQELRKVAEEIIGVIHAACARPQRIDEGEGQEKPPSPEFRN